MDRCSWAQHYSSKTLIGPWLQQRQLEQDRLDDFIERCRTGNLAIQKITRLYHTFMEEVSERSDISLCVKLYKLTKRVISDELRFRNEPIARTAVALCVDVYKPIFLTPSRLT